MESSAHGDGESKRLSGRSAAEVDGTQNLPLHQYETLETGCIRLFELFPGHGQDPVTGALHHIALMDAHERYEAISYTWGDLAVQETIICNNSQRSVTRSLHLALLRLRKTNSVVLLWIDGVCIDQGKNLEALQERAQQVAMMSEIYANATRVIIDLGHTDQDFSYLIGRLEQYTKIDPDPTTYVLDEAITLPGSDGPDLIDSKLWVQLIRLMRLSWFSRLWCCQKFIMARRTATLLGSRLISNFDLHLGITRSLFRLQKAAVEEDLSLEMLEELWIDVKSVQRNLAVLFRKQTLHNQRVLHQKMTWEAMMAICRQMEVTDPRDRIYAIYALLPENLVANFAIDYTETVPAFQKRLSRHLIERNRGIWALLHASGPSHELPSWTVTLYDDDRRYWRQGQLALFADSLNNFPSDPSPKFWRAGGSSPYTLSTGIVTHELHSRGHVFDHISTMSDRQEPTYTGDMRQSGDALSQWIANVILWSESVGIAENVLWRLLMFDGYGEVRILPQYADADRRDAAFSSSYQHLKQFVFSDHEAYPTDSMLLGRPLLQQIAMNLINMCLATTVNGIAAVVPYTAVVGDRLAVLTGVNVPFVFRPTDDKYQLVGPCYLHGLMDGQVLEHEDWDSKPLIII